MTLLASMIVRNEMSRFLPLVVQHLLTFCDSVIVLDDNSDDGTFEWCDTQSNVLVQRNTGPQFYEYESQARQQLLDWTLFWKPDWVLSIDADEFVSHPEALHRAMWSEYPVWTLDMEEVWKADVEHLHMRVDGQWGPRLCPILWKAPKEVTSEWAIPPRKLACGREPAIVRRTKFRKSGSSVYHFGWTREAARQARFDRYMEHDQGKFHANKHLQSIMWGDDRVKLASKPWPVHLEQVRGGILSYVDQPTIAVSSGA